MTGCYNKTEPRQQSIKYANDGWYMIAIICFYFRGFVRSHILFLWQYPSKTSKVLLVSGVDFRCLADEHRGNRILGDDEWHQQQSISLLMMDNMRVRGFKGIFIQLQILKIRIGCQYVMAIYTYTKSLYIRSIVKSFNFSSFYEKYMPPTWNKNIRGICYYITSLYWVYLYKKSLKSPYNIRWWRKWIKFKSSLLYTAYILYTPTKSLIIPAHILIQILNLSIDFVYFSIEIEWNLRQFKNLKKILNKILF